MSKGRVINRCLILISLVTGGLTMVWVQHLTRGCSRGMWACVCIRVCESVASGWPDVTVLFLRKLELTRPPGWALLYLWWHWMQIHLQPGIAQIHVADIKFWQGATLCYTVRAHLGRSLPVCQNNPDQTAPLTLLYNSRVICVSAYTCI